MPLRIDNDKNRFRQIIRGRIKQNLRKYMSSGEMIGKKGDKLVSIPIPRIDIPHFVHSPKKQGGVGQGDGDEGSPIGQGKPQDGEGQAGSAPGRHLLEVDVPLEELASILSEELALPRIEPKGQKKNVEAVKEKYSGIHRAGPDSLRHFKRTFKQAIKRQIVSGTYNPDKPIVVPIRDDLRFRSWKTIPQPATNAIIIYIMDVSGSMGNEQKDIVRTTSFWIDTWLKSQYKGVEARYIIHDAAAREVDQETFYHTRESGGTIISSAYKACERMIYHDYDPQEWNIYVFHFSDGDNWSGEDTALCIDLLKKRILPGVNLFCYGQVESQYGSGQFIKDLNENLHGMENLSTAKIDARENIYDAIKSFLGKGK